MIKSDIILLESRVTFYFSVFKKKLFQRKFPNKFPAVCNQIEFMSLEIALKPFQKLKCFQNNIFVEVKAVIYITFIALKDELPKMIGSNNEKTFYLCKFLCC